MTIMRWRIALGAVGALGILYGIKLLFAQPKVNHPWQVVKWAIATDIVTDGLLIPAAIAVGWLLLRVRPRARRYIQGALISVASVTIIALPMIHRRGQQRPGQALLQQNYTANLAILVGVISAAAVALYARRVVLDERQRSSATNVRPPADQASPIE